MVEQEIMPEEPILKEQWRANAILAWLKADAELKDCRLVGNVEDELAELEEAKSYADYEFHDTLTQERFLVVKLTIYCPEDGERELDEMDWVSVPTLELAKHELEDHIFTERRADYFYECKVFDTNLRREQPWHEVRYTEWGHSPES